MKTCITLLLGACIALVSGCSTIQGAGQDIERTGEKVSAAANAARVALHQAISSAEEQYRRDLARCDTLAEDQRAACRSRARVAYTQRRDEARATYRAESQRSSFRDDSNEEAYEAARDRCDRLSGADEDRCIREARASYWH
jgi:predicted small secreted protein